MRRKINFGKIAAYSAGAAVGGGLTWLGWRYLDGRGINPTRLFKKKVEEGNRIYYDPTKDPSLNNFSMDGVGSLEIDEDEEEEEDSDDGGAVVVTNKTYSEPYQIDEETWYHSEEDEGMTHGRLTYYKLDKQVGDENHELILEPWKKIGIANYEELTDGNSEDQLFIRDETNHIDYVITKEEGAFDD